MMQRKEHKVKRIFEARKNDIRFRNIRGLGLFEKFLDIDSLSGINHFLALKVGNHSYEDIDGIDLDLGILFEEC